MIKFSLEKTHLLKPQEVTMTSPPPSPPSLFGINQVYFIKIFAFVLDNKFCFFRYAIHANASDFIHKI